MISSTQPQSSFSTAGGRIGTPLPNQIDSMALSCHQNAWS